MNPHYKRHQNNYFILLFLRASKNSQTHNKNPLFPSQPLFLGDAVGFCLGWGLGWRLGWGSGWDLGWGLGWGFGRGVLPSGGNPASIIIVYASMRVLWKLPWLFPNSTTWTFIMWWTLWWWVCMSIRVVQCTRTVNDVNELKHCKTLYACDYIDTSSTGLWASKLTCINNYDSTTVYYVFMLILKTPKFILNFGFYRRWGTWKWLSSRQHKFLSSLHNITFQLTVFFGLI